MKQPQLSIGLFFALEVLSSKGANAADISYAKEYPLFKTVPSFSPTQGSPSALVTDFPTFGDFMQSASFF
jgi:hypothetical protein